MSSAPSTPAASSPVPSGEAVSPASGGEAASPARTPGSSDAPPPSPLDVGSGHVRRSCEASDRFFASEADAIARACRAMARRFRDGGHLLVFAGDGCASDADHVAVEFVHPVIVGKRALPARALSDDAARGLRLVASPEDIALGITADGDDPEVLAALRIARELGLLTIGLAGGAGGALGREELDHAFTVSSDDPTIVQEVQETLYHVLWELVHVFFEQGGAP